jgi:hypothetical protein
MTELEIMKALECCSNNVLYENCLSCPYEKYLEKGHTCIILVTKSTLALLNRKNAEIEKLCGEVDELIIAKDQLFDEAEALIKKARAEAIKEFAIRLAMHFGTYTENDSVRVVDLFRLIDQIAKEMGVEL